MVKSQNDQTEINTIHLQVAGFVLFVFPFFNGFYNPMLVEYPFNFWFLDFFSHVILPLLVWIFLFKYSGVKFKDIGIQIPTCKKEWFNIIIHSIILSIFFYKGNNIFYELVSIFAQKYPQVFDYSEMIPQGKMVRVIISFYYSLTAFPEEFYYRGLLVLLFTRNKIHKLIIVLFSSFIFSIVHWESGSYNVLSLFFLSLVLTTYYLRYKMLIPLIIGHLITDFIYFNYQ